MPSQKSDAQAASCQPRTLTRAAEVLRDEATCLRESHTVSGEWDDSTPADRRARAEHDEMLELAAELDRLVSREAVLEERDYPRQVRELVIAILDRQAEHVEDNAKRLAAFETADDEPRCRALAASYLRECANTIRVGFKLDEVDALLREQINDAKPAAPAGYVLVPKEPSEAMVDAARQIVVYAEVPGRTLEGLRAHLVSAGVDYLGFFPVWATQECGHLTKAGLAELIYVSMLAAQSKPEERE